MNNFDDWSQIISKFLKAEADMLNNVSKSEAEAEKDTARTSFIHGVLERLLPKNHAIGSGRIIDSRGETSKHIDIIIYRNDFPHMHLPGCADIFLYESVLATIEVRAKLIRKTLFDALDICASVAELEPSVDSPALAKIASYNNMTLNKDKQYIHEQPLLTERFNLIGRPPCFIYGFNGLKASPGQLKENIDIWFEDRQKNNLAVDLKSLPAVIATQGCAGWRNAAPLSANSNHLFAIASDAAPIRLIVLQLLYLLHLRLKTRQDGNGMRPGIGAYISQIAAPETLFTIGEPRNPGDHPSEAAENSVTGSEPEIIELEIIEPEVIEPEVIEPEVIEPEVIEPEVIEPEVIEPEVIEPEVIEPEAIEPEVIEPEVIEPEVIEPEVIEPEVIEPEVIEPEMIEPEVIEPEMIEPEIVEPEVVEPRIDADAYLASENESDTEPESDPEHPRSHS